MSNQTWLKPLLIVLVVLALGISACSAVAVGGWALAQTVQRTAQAAIQPTPQAVQVQPEQPVAPQVANLTAQADQQDQLLNAVYQQANPAVVNIQVTSQVSAPQFGVPNVPGLPQIPAPQGPRNFYQQGVGSGFVIDTQGHIVTNNHVVDGADQIQVTFWDDTSVPATLVGRDPDSDLAVIKVDVATEKLHPVTLGDSDSLKVGQRVIAIGNPFGLEGTLTTGVVSAVGRSVPAGPIVSASGGQYTIPDVIQTDAAINPGNSGGPLLDIHGQVVGVNFMIESQSGSNAGVGFAIPVAIVKQVVPQLVATGQYAHPWLGISGTTVSQDLVDAAKLPVERGVLVVTVTDGSPAAKAGLQPSNDTVTIRGQQVPTGGDIIVAIDDQPVRKFEDLTTYLARDTKVGQEITLTVLRDGQQVKVPVTLGERPQTQNSQQAP
jgi:serine protease Do